MFGTFNVIAGDFKEGNAHQLVRKHLLMKTSGLLFREKIPVSHIAELSVASQESVNRIGGAIGWGLAGEALLGPVGLLAGVLRGGRGRNVTFVCRLKDGRRFLATASARAFSVLQQAAIKSAYYRTSLETPTPELTDEEKILLPSENPNHPGHIGIHENRQTPKKRPSMLKDQSGPLLAFSGFAFLSVSWLQCCLR